MTHWKRGLMAAAAISAMGLSACATQDYVNKKVDPVTALAEANQADLANTRGELTSVQGRLQAHDARLEGLDAATREALTRADAAGKLAEGKFLYSMVLSDDGVKFPNNGTKLSPEAEQRLAGLAEKLKGDNKPVYLEIQGFTDASGPDTVNERLGRERAEAVRRYLSQQGVPLNRMNTISYGEANPVAPNNTRKGRAENRRVVVVVLS